jgi:replication fork clamp-binding protein CrfC
VPIKGQP